MNDIKSFRQEWQVTNKDAQLFQTSRAPQYPAKCILPDPKASQKRRLGETSAKAKAEEVCARHVVPEEFEQCVAAVMAFDDVDVAGVF